MAVNVLGLKPELFTLVSKRRKTHIAVGTDCLQFLLFLNKFSDIPGLAVNQRHSPNYCQT